MKDDISLNTLVVSSVIALCTWALKGGVTALVKALWQNMAKMALLEAKIDTVVKIVDDVPKIQKDVNEAFRRLRDIEDIPKNQN